jgi:hypothetical protein
VRCAYFQRNYSIVILFPHERRSYIAHPPWGQVIPHVIEAL